MCSSVASRCEHGLDELRPGDQIVVTRLRRIGRKHQDLLDLVAWFEKHEVDFVVLEQASTPPPPIGRLFSGSWLLSDAVDDDDGVIGSVTRTVFLAFG